MNSFGIRPLLLLNPPPYVLQLSFARVGACDPDRSIPIPPLPPEHRVYVRGNDTGAAAHVQHLDGPLQRRDLLVGQPAVVDERLRRRRGDVLRVPVHASDVRAAPERRVVGPVPGRVDVLGGRGLRRRAILGAQGRGVEEELRPADALASGLCVGLHGG